MTLDYTVYGVVKRIPYNNPKQDLLINFMLLLRKKATNTNEWMCSLVPSLTGPYLPTRFKFKVRLIILDQNADMARLPYDGLVFERSFL